MVPDDALAQQVVVRELLDAFRPSPLQDIAPGPFARPPHAPHLFSVVSNETTNYKNPVVRVTCKISFEQHHSHNDYVLIFTDIQTYLCGRKNMKSQRETIKALATEH